MSDTASAASGPGGGGGGHRRGGGGDHRDRRGGGGGGGRQGGRQGGGGNSRDKRNKRDNRQQQLDDGRPPPVILAKTGDRNADFPTLQQAAATSRQQQSGGSSSEQTASEAASSSSSSPARVLLKAKDAAAESVAPAAASSSSRQADSPKPAAGSTRDEQQQQGRPTNSSSTASATPDQERACKFIDDSHQMSDNLASFLTDNADFLVVGVFGPQGSGKSTVLNAIAGSDVGLVKSQEGVASQQSGVFRTQTFEKQMMSEHCTNGVNAWISPQQRVVLLDCVAADSFSVLDRMLHSEKRYPAEFNTAEATVEVHSLQLAGFLYNVCHLLLVVTEAAASPDPQTVRTLLAAEMLKPSSPAAAAIPSEGEGESSSAPSVVVEHLPEVILVHNKSRLGDYSRSRLAKARRFYEKSLCRSSHLHLKTGLGSHHDDGEEGEDEGDDGLNLFLLPDFEFGSAQRSSSVATSGGFDPGITFEAEAARLRRTVLSAGASLARTPLTTASRTAMTERSWMQFARKSWDAVKNSPFYMEYNRLL